MLKRAFVIVLILMAVGAVLVAQQDDETTTLFGYFLAPDSDGVVQVWSYALDDGPQQLTTLSEDIYSFGVGADGEGLTFNTADTLWYQPPGGEPTALTPVSLDLDGGATGIPYTAPAISPDGTQIVYRNDGLQVIDVIGGEPRLLVENRTDMQDIDNWRFMLNADFLSDNLLLAEVGIWESVVPAIVDVTTGDITEAPRYEMARASVISDGQLILFTNSFRGLRPGLEIATAETIAQPEPITDGTFGIDGQFADTIVFDVAEMDNGVLRVFLQWLDPNTESGQIPLITTIIDYDTEAGSGTYVIEPSSENAIAALNRPQLSPDGQYVIGYTEFNGQSGEFSGFQVISIADGSVLDLMDIPDGINEFIFAG